MIILSYCDIAPETLNKLLEEIVSRDGTDYGDSEVSIEQKINQVILKLKSGEACLCYDEQTESCNVLSTIEAQKLLE